MRLTRVRSPPGTDLVRCKVGHLTVVWMVELLIRALNVTIAYSRLGGGCTSLDVAVKAAPKGPWPNRLWKGDRPLACKDHHIIYSLFQLRCGLQYGAVYSEILFSPGCVDNQFDSVQGLLVKCMVLEWYVIQVAFGKCGSQWNANEKI